MILTLTTNPSVDKTVFVDTLARGAVNRSTRTRTEPSGKGVNVSLALHRHGHKTTAILPVGGNSGAEVAHMLNAATLPTVQIAMAGDVRENLSIVEPDGTVTKINEPGPHLSSTELDTLLDCVLDNLDGSTWLACCGSLPPGAPIEFYADVTKLARERGVDVVVDTSGPALEASLPGRPSLIKPNSHELAEVVGRSLPTLGDVVDAAHELRNRGVDAVLVSLGADGALLVTADDVLHGEARVDTVVSSVGAGDALLAGFLYGGGRGSAALTSALTWGAAAVQHEGTLFDTVGLDIPVVIHNTVDRDRKLVDDAG